MKTGTIHTLILVLAILTACSKKDTTNTTTLKLTSILQTSIDTPQLQGFYHENKISNRKPLRVALNQPYANKIHLEKFNMPAIITTAKKCNPNQPCLIISKIKIDHLSATVSFSYPTEGIQGTVELQKKNSKWITVKTNIVEH